MAAQKTLRPSTVSSSTRAEHRGEADYPSTFYRCWSPNTSTSDLGILARLPPTSYRCWFSQHRQGQSRQALVPDLAVWESWRDCRLPPTGVVFNTSRGRADKRSSQPSRSGSYGATAAYLLPVLSQHQQGQSRQALVPDLAVWESWRDCRLPPAGDVFKHQQGQSRQALAPDLAVWESWRDRTSSYLLLMLVPQH